MVLKLPFISPFLLCSDYNKYKNQKNSLINMQSFLQLVAHDLYTKIGNDLSRTVLVFPNKRANLFFNEYLAGESDKPIWSPAEYQRPVSETIRTERRRSYSIGLRTL